MTLAIKMRGELSEIVAPNPFLDFVNDLNIAGAQGKQYVLLKDVDDHGLALNTQNIISIREMDDDLSGMIG